jgi:hypothetical protein
VLKIDTGFSGGSLGEHHVDRASLRARLRQEALVEVDGFRYDYNRHFAFGLHNTADETLPVEVRIDGPHPAGKLTEEALLFTADAPTADFKPMTVPGGSDGLTAYRFSLVLGPRQRLYVANYLFRQYETLQATFDALAANAGGRRRVFGRTIEGRPLVAYSFTAASGAGAGRPAVLVTSGLHPPESDTVGTQAILEAVGTRELSHILGACDLHVVPIANPDGFVHGYNGCNAAQVNFFWQFEAGDRDRCPEAHFLWKLIEDIEPVAYVDFHGYTFQPRRKKPPSPYLKPTILYAGRSVRRFVRRLNAAVLALSDGCATRGVLTYSPSMLSTRITRAYNTVTYAKYHLCLRDGAEANRRLAVGLVRTIGARLSDAGINDSRIVLKRPFGSVDADLVHRAGALITPFWGLRGRPALARLKRQVTAAGRH